MGSGAGLILGPGLPCQMVLAPRTRIFRTLHLAAFIHLEPPLPRQGPRPGGPGHPTRATKGQKPIAREKNRQSVRGSVDNPRVIGYSDTFSVIEHIMYQMFYNRT